MGRCNARTHLSHPPPAFYEWGECTRVYFFKVVQFRRSCTLILKMACCSARTHFSHLPPRFYEWGECSTFLTRLYEFEILMVQWSNFEVFYWRQEALRPQAGMDVVPYYSFRICLASRIGCYESNRIKRLRHDAHNARTRPFTLQQNSFHTSCEPSLYPFTCIWRFRASSCGSGKRC